MNTELITTTAGDMMPATVLTDEHVAALAELAKFDKAANTRKAYASGLAIFQGWLDAHPGYTADAKGIGAFLTDLDRAGAKTSTIKARLAALRAVHDDAKNKAIDGVMESIMRRRAEIGAGNASHSKQQVTLDQLREMCATPPAGLTETRNRALLLVGFWLAARRSELVAMRVEDVQWDKGGAYVTIHKSKTDQKGEKPAVLPLVKLAAGDKDICPCTALKAWLQLAGIASGFIFITTNHDKLTRARKPITAQVVALVVKAYCERVGLDPDAFAGHSLRSGFVTAARQLNISDAIIKKVTRHKSTEMLDRYDHNGAREALAVIRRAVSNAPQDAAGDDEGGA
jgi:integrase